MNRMLIAAVAALIGCSAAPSSSGLHDVAVTHVDDAGAVPIDSDHMDPRFADSETRSSCAGLPRFDCNGYSEIECTDGIYRVTGGQSCCTAVGRFAVSKGGEYGDFVHDTHTGFTWNQMEFLITDHYPNATCSSYLGEGWTDPSVAELRAISIGAEDRTHVATTPQLCSPAVDQVAFPWTHTESVRATDGWFSLTSGYPVRAPLSGESFALFCVRR